MELRLLQIKNENPIELTRPVVITLSNGKELRIHEEQGELVITSLSDGLTITPHVSNVIGLK